MTFDLDSMLEPVEISKVSEKLNEKQQELRTEGGAALIYNINFIVPIVSKDALEKFKKVINVIGKHYPCRYFLVEILEQAKQLTAEAGVYSFGSENTNRSFSEIVRVKTSVDTLKALPSVLRAQKIEGINTELLLIDAELPVEGLKIPFTTG
ncbi:MAG: hypothetical protein R3A13_03800 [Bdellovibrionota bacterium]